MGALYLIRHGQASFAQADYDALSDTGIEQSRVLGEALRARVPQVDAVFSGSMRRHRQTAERCLAAYGYAGPVEEAAGLNEYDHDEIIVRYRPRYADRSAMLAELVQAGNPRRAFQEMFTQAVARWVSGRHDDEYSESWPAFRARTVAALERIIAALNGSGTALVFTSGGPISAVAQTLLHIPDEHAFQINWTLANCGVSKVIYSSRGRYLSTLNEHGHFEGPRQQLITYR